MTKVIDNLIVADAMNRALLLANKDRSGLFIIPDTDLRILMERTGKSTYALSEINQHEYTQLHLPLSELMAEYFDLNDDASSAEMLKYFVTPEMEVERIFNCLRFKYLNSIHVSNFENPQKFISSTYNRAFQTLAGLTVYQGSAKRRKNNDDFWQEAGFTAAAKDQNWQREQDDMQFILSVMKRMSVKVAMHYAELIAIKPGFHELYLHEDYFSEYLEPTATSARDIVFRMLRNRRNKVKLRLKVFPPEINKRSYFGYAPCNVTEGPFVFRKNRSVSYCEEIRQITSRQQLRELNRKFHILDYYHRDLSSRKKLADFLETAKAFRHFMI